MSVNAVDILYGFSFFKCVAAWNEFDKFRYEYIKNIQLETPHSPNVLIDLETFTKHWRV